VSAPYIFITTQSTTEGSLQDYLEHNLAFAEFLKASEPSLVDFQVYIDQQRTEVTLVFVFRDAEAAEIHMQVAREKLGRGLEIELDGGLDAAFSVASTALDQQARGLRRAATHRQAAAPWQRRTGQRVEGQTDSSWRDLYRRVAQLSRR
jgi:quinol monooxygenase YgiN